MKNRRVFLASALAVLCLGAFTAVSARGADALPSHSDERYWKDMRGGPILTTAYWEERIRKDGGTDAYAFLKRQVEPLDDYGRHLTAHQFGNALYLVEGLDGIVVCDNSLGNGCFHQFFMAALGERGEGLVRALSEECATRVGPGIESHACHHGMGHGIMVAFGEEDLSSALEACKAVSYIQGFYGCTDGVFMEYFKTTHLGSFEESELIRTFDPENPYSPCEALTEEFKPSCHYMQMSWWMYTGMTHEEAAALCRGVREYSYACFKAMGHVLTLATKYDKEPTIAWCKALSATFEEEILCRAGAHWAFSRGEEVGEVLSEDEKKLCEFDTAEASRRCADEAALAGTSLGISVICCKPLH